MFPEPLVVKLSDGFRSRLSPAINHQKMRIMKTLLTGSSRWLTLGFIVAALWLVAPASVQAGESILFSREKPRTGPEKGTLAPRDDGRNRLGPITPFDLDLPSQPDSRSRNVQKDRKQKAAELEKKNWMVYSPGELQEREEENTALGIRDLDLEKDDGTAGGLFSRKDDDKNRSRLPSQPNRPGAPNARPPGDEALKSPADDNASKQESPEKKDAKSTDTSLKALMSKGNDLRLNLGSAKPGSEAVDSSSLRSLAAGSANDRTPVQPVRQQNSADAGSFSGSSTTLKPAGADGFGAGTSWRTDYSAKSGTPGFAPPVSRRADDFSSSLNGASGGAPGGNSTIPSGSDQNFGRNLNPYSINAPALNSPSAQRLSPGGGLGGPSPFPQLQQPNSLQRTTRDTFSIPSR